jgi:DNA transformation protein
LDAETLQELFAEFGPVSIRRMFGGMGVFADGLMIALVSRGVIFLKADAETIPVFEHEGQAPFSYATKNGEHTLTSYWRMPDRLYDDAEELARWARDAHAVALRKAAGKPQPRAAKPETRPAKRALRPAKRALRPAKRAKKKR